MELVEKSVSVLRCGDITQKIMLLVGLPLVYLINKLPVLFETNYVHGVIKNLIPAVILSFNHNVIKGKVFPVHALERQRGAEVQLHSFLTLAEDGDEWLTS
jgi:hypothetical protein